MDEQSVATAPETNTVQDGRKVKRDRPWLVKPRLQAPWEAIRDAVASGVSMSKVAKRFAEYHPNGAESMHELIRKRASRERWLVPATAMANAKARLSEAGYDVTGTSQSVETASSDPEKVGTLVAESAQELAESGSLIGLKLVHGLLKSAAASPGQIAPLVDVQDLASAVKLARMAGGLDKQQAPVQFNLWGSPGQAQGQPQPVRDILNIENWADDE